MPRYYFHIRDDDELVPDSSGVELSDLKVAAKHCGKVVAEVLAEEAWQAELVAGRQFEIADEAGRTVLILPFAKVEVGALPLRHTGVRRRR